MKSLVFLSLACFYCSAQTVWFEPNMGQVKGQTEWVGRSKGAYLYITGNEVVYANKTNVHMRLIGAKTHAGVEGIDPTGGYSSYFTGGDEKTWFTGIPHYGRVRYRDVYPAIDLVYYASAQNVEYDFVLHPGADPQRIELAFSEPVRIDQGDLIVAGLRQHKPKVLQDGIEIAAAYDIKQSGRVRVALGEYDRSRDLAIDPILEFSSYLGGPGEDHGTGVAVDGSGNVLIAGGTQSPATPALNPFQQTNLVGAQPFVLKLSADGQHVLYFAVISSQGYDRANALALDSSGSPIVTGNTVSANFPLKNAFQTQFKATYPTGFVTKLSADGKSLVFSSFLGGSVGETPNAVIVDKSNNVFVAGLTQSKDFPVKSAFQPTFAGGYDDWFVTKISPSGELLASTYLGGGAGPYEGCYGLALAPDGNLLLVGNSNAPDFPLKHPLQNTPSPSGFATALLVKMTSDLQTMITSTFIGGTAYGLARSVATDVAGNIWIGGEAGPNFPTTSDAVQPATESGGGNLLLALDSNLQSVLYATYLGSGAYSGVTGVATDNAGFIYVSGSAGAPDVPFKNALQNWKGGGIRNADCFVAKFASSRALIYATPIGGSGTEFCRPLVVDNSGNAYTVGDTASFDFPVKNAYQGSYGGGGDAFVVKISDSTIAPQSPLSVLPQRVTFRFTQGGSLPVVQTVKVNGGAFSSAANVPWLTINAQPPNVIVSANPSGLPPGTYNGTVTFTPTSGTPATIDAILTVLAPVPILTSIDPSLVAIGSDDSPIVVHGSGFTSNSIIQVDGTFWTITPVQFVNNATLQFSMPANYFSIAYNHTIAVQNPQSALSNTLSVAVGVPPPSFSAASVVNAASFGGGAVAPGEIVTIFGTNLVKTVAFDSLPATIVYSSATQVSATVPYDIGGPKTTVQVGSSAPVSLDVAPSAPGIFAAVSNGDGTLTLYATGCGPLTQDALPVCQLPVSATVNGESAQVPYAGMAPGLVQGTNQINLMIPTDLASGPVTIVLTAGTASSKPFSYTLP